MMELERLQKANHKAGVNPIDWETVHSNLIKLGIFYLNFCEKHRIPVLFTSIIRPMIPGISKSRTHEQGRAFDASVKGWTTDLIDEFLIEGNRIFEDIAAISLDGKPRAFVCHDGSAMHIHSQVRP